MVVYFLPIKNHDTLSGKKLIEKQNKKTENE